MKEKEIKSIRISIQREVDDILNEQKINKSKLINSLITDFFNKKGSIESFLRKK